MTGDFIRVIHGSLAGMTGTIVASIGGGRVLVHLTCWGIEQAFDAADLRIEQRVRQRREVSLELPERVAAD